MRPSCRTIMMSGRWPCQQGLMANHTSLGERVDLPEGDKTRGTGAYFAAAAARPEIRAGVAMRAGLRLAPQIARMSLISLDLHKEPEL